MGLISIHGLDTEKGIVLTGGTVEAYSQVLSMFCKDAEDRLQRLRFFLFEGLNAGSGKFPEKHLSSLTTQIYALKSALATIGAADVSIEAEKLEAAGKNMDLVFINDNLPNFVDHLAELVKNIRAFLGTKPEENAVKTGGGFFKQIFSKQKPDKPLPEKADSADCLPVFQELKEALKTLNVYEIDRILCELGKKSLDSKTKEVFDHISDQVLMTEFDSAIKTIEDLINKNK